MTSRLHVALLFGGRSGEHEISLMSARSVMGALDPEKYDVSAVGITREGVWLSGGQVLEAFESGSLETLHNATLLPEPGRSSLYLVREEGALETLARFDVVFPVLHGTYGEDGTIQGLLELAEVPYVGAGVLASAVAMDKGLFKELMLAHGIPVLEFAIIQAGDLEEPADAVFETAESVSPYPLFTKPANMGSSVGVSLCRGRADLIEGLLEAAQYDRRVLVERGIEGREIEVSVLGNEAPEASVPGEVIPSDEFYSYRAKYLDDASELIIPAQLDEDQTQRVRQLALDSFKAIDGAGMARVDFLLDKVTGDIYLNELNTIPGFTRISMYPKLWEASGITYPQLMDRLIDLAFDRHSKRARLVRSYGGEA